MTFEIAYTKAKTGGDLDKAIKEHLTYSEAKELVNAMQIVKKHTGLNMRQDFLLITLRAMLKHGNSVLLFAEEILV